MKACSEQAAEMIKTALNPLSSYLPGLYPCPRGQSVEMFAVPDCYFSPYDFFVGNGCDIGANYLPCCLQS